MIVDIVIYTNKILEDSMGALLENVHFIRVVSYNAMQKIYRHCTNEILEDFMSALLEV